MMLLDYVCDRCGCRSEDVWANSRADNLDCFECGAPMRSVYSLMSVEVKVGKCGNYSTGYQTTQRL
jgi:predicted nucleic acid-binding Zn ribbon protein